MNICLINPPFLFPVKGEFSLSQCIGLRSLSAVLKQRNHQVQFLDALYLGFSNYRPYANGYIVGLDIPDIVARIDASVQFVGVSVPFSQLAPIAHDLISAIKVRLPGVTVIMGGVYPSTQPELAQTSDADFLILGEAENALVELVEGTPVQTIQGVYSCRSASPVTRWVSAIAPQDLDRLPFPDVTIPEMGKYYSFSPRLSLERAAAIVTSRGCPFDCHFCSVHPVCGFQWRGRSAGHVLEEITMLVKQFGVQALEIEDDNFTMQPQRTLDIIRGIMALQEQGTPLSWRTPNGIRIDTLNEEILQAFKKANCQEIVLALEHGDQDVLKCMNKKLDLDVAFRVIEQCLKLGFPRIILFFIVGYPGETRQRFENAVAYLKRIRSLGGPVILHANLTQPYPGTKLLKYCREKGYVKDPNIDNFLIRRNLASTMHYFALETEDFDEQEVLRRKKILSELFDATPSWVRDLKTRIRECLPPGTIRKIQRLKQRIFHSKNA